MQKIEKLEQKVKELDIQILDNEKAIKDLRAKICDFENTDFKLRNEKANLNFKISELKNLKRKKFGVMVIMKNENTEREFETLKECSDYINTIEINKEIIYIRVDINKARL